MRPHPVTAPLAPLVLGTVLLAGALFLGGCSSPASEQAEDAMSINGGAERSYTDEELQNGVSGSIFPDTFTFTELLSDHRCQAGQAQGDGYGAGGYIVGAEGAPAPGTYYLNGSQEKAGSFHVYAPADEEGRYRSKYAISYLGFTFVTLDENDALFFKPPAETDIMSVASDAPLDVKIPYESGLYRVGIDIPAGTYTVTQSKEDESAIAAMAYTQPQVIVYSSLAFGTNNTVTQKDLPRLEDGPIAVEITVSEGQFLELYGCAATPLALP